MLDFLYLQSLLDLQSLALNSGLGKLLQLISALSSEMA